MRFLGYEFMIKYHLEKNCWHE